MKILAVSHLFPNEHEHRYGIFVARQLCAMAQEGAEITVLVPRAFSPSWVRRLLREKTHDHTAALCQFPELTVYAVPFPVLPGRWFKRWSGLSAFWCMRRKAAALHEQEEFDVIYATDVFLDGDAAQRLSRLLDIPAACLAIGDDVNVLPKSSRRMHDHFVRIISQLDATLACGDSLARNMDAITGRDSLSVYGVVDLEMFAPAGDKEDIRDELGLPREKTIVIYAGYLLAQKGLLELIRAIEDVLDSYPEAFLVICGHRGDPERIQLAAATSRARAAIRFVGDVPPNRVNKFMQASDLFVLPSYSEGMPNVVMEAMACGLPVVATTVGGLVDALGNCEGAMLVPPRQHEQLGKAMNAIIGSQVVRSRMSLAARKKAEESFGARSNARKILGFLGDVVGRWGRPGG